MTTHHMAEQAVAYWTGELSAALRADADAHLITCAACREEFERVRIALGAVASWPRDPVLDARLEQRILAALASTRAVANPALPASAPAHSRKLEAMTHRSRMPAMAALVLALVSGAAGFALGRLDAPTLGTNTTTPADSTLHSYLLLLEEPVWPPPRSLERAGYGDWVRALAAERRFVEAEKLTEEPGYRVTSDGRVTRPDTTVRPPNVSGWYVLRAGSYDDAIAWARRGPHLAYGSVLVREIEPTERTVPR